MSSFPALVRMSCGTGESETLRLVYHGHILRLIYLLDCTHRCSDLPAMKRLLSFKSIPAVKSVPAAPANPTGTVPHTTSLQPKYVLPPLPHPCPHEHIALLATAQGLLLRPHFLSETRPESYVRILWGKTGAIEELPINEDADQDWSESVIIYGIVGILELFSGI